MRLPSLGRPSASGSLSVARYLACAEFVLQEQIRILYDELLRIRPSPVVALNRAVALSMTNGPEAALTQIQELDQGGRLAGYRILHATKTDMLCQLGCDIEAVRHTRQPSTSAATPAEQGFFTERLDRIWPGV